MSFWRKFMFNRSIFWSSPALKLISCHVWLWGCLVCGMLQLGIITPRQNDIGMVFWLLALPPPPRGLLQHFSRASCCGSLLNEKKIRKQTRIKKRCFAENSKLLQCAGDEWGESKAYSSANKERCQVRMVQLWETTWWNEAGSYTSDAGPVSACADIPGLLCVSVNTNSGWSQLAGFQCWCFGLSADSVVSKERPQGIYWLLVYKQVQ